jgi:hypothetical protein
MTIANALQSQQFQSVILFTHRSGKTPPKPCQIQPFSGQALSLLAGNAKG